jgi:hypothetical protein
MKAGWTFPLKTTMPFLMGIETAHVVRILRMQKIRKNELSICKILII